MFVALQGLVACGNSMSADEQTASTPKQDGVKSLTLQDVAQAKQQDLQNSIAFSGDLTAKNSATVSSEVGGTVLRVVLKEGNAVNKGQELAFIDSQSSRENLNAQQAQLNNAQANLRLANTQLKQKQVLFEKNYISRLALEQAQNEHQVAVGAVNAQQAELAKLQKYVRDARVVSPLTGVVYEKTIQEGELIGAGQKLFAIADMRVLEVSAQLTEAQIGLVKVGQSVELTTRSNGEISMGQVSRINPVANANTRDFTVYIEVNNAEGKLNIGQFVNGSIVIGSTQKAVVLPLSTLRSDDEGKNTYVLSVNPQKQVVRTPVKIVLRNESKGLMAVEGIGAGVWVLQGKLLGVAVKDTVNVPSVSS